MRSTFALRPEGNTVIVIAFADGSRRNLAGESAERVIGPQHTLHRETERRSPRIH